MTIKVDAKYMGDLGFGSLADRERAALARGFFESLEEQVGCVIARDLTDRQLTGFQRAMDDGEEAALAWLNTNVPDHAAIVQATHSAFSKRVAALAPLVAEKIVEARLAGRSSGRLMPPTDMVR